MASNTIELPLSATPAVHDRQLIVRGHDRCATARFALWLAPWIALLALGGYAVYLCLRYGLNQTNMDNRFAFGLWIFLDLSVIALGAGAFFTGFLLYILKWKDLKAVINSAVILGFLCYSGAMAALAVDVGQPMRAWFTFWHPNVHSMLTEVTFCISCYLLVLAFEYLPILLRHRKLKEVPSFIVFEFEMHKVVPVLAAVGTFLSFFHQGSLGGLYGVLRGHPFAYREGIAIWPSTFFLFILSAIAVGPSFILLTTRLVEKLGRKQLVRFEVKRKLAKTSGILLLVYVAMKSVDTLIWLNATSRQMGFFPWEYYAWKPFGYWVLLTEIVLCGFVPAVLLIWPRTQSRQPWMLAAAALACAGVVLNRFVLTIQTLALPTLPFDEFLTYAPSWQEFATFGGVVAYAVLVYSLSYRYLNLFPQERELSQEAKLVSGVNGFHWAFGHIVFLTVFGLVLATVCVTMLVALARTRLNLGRAEKIRWHSEFGELQAHGRCCRHELTGEVESRECPHAFDCRSCSDHLKHGPAAASTEDEVYGLSYPAKRLYHRGHTWVECEDGGALTIGLDEIGRRVIGRPDAVVMPGVGTRIETNGAGWRMRKDGVEIRILSPVDGTVIATGSPEDDWFLRVLPATPDPDLRHLLRGAEVRAWVGRELERLQLLFTPEGSTAALADGGVLMHDLIGQQPHERRDSLLGEVFLEP